MACRERFIELRAGITPDHVAEVFRKGASRKGIVARYNFQ